MSAEMKRTSAKVACVVLTSTQVLGLLKGTLRPEPPLPADVELYLDAWGDALWKPVMPRTFGEGYDPRPGVYLGLRSDTFDPVAEGNALPVLDVKFVPVNEGG